MSTFLFFLLLLSFLFVGVAADDEEAAAAGGGARFMPASVLVHAFALSFTWGLEEIRGLLFTWGVCGLS